MFDSRRFSRNETFLLWLAILSAAAIRCWFIVAHKIDSDEPQHLHVVWALSRGLVLYRDVFDNHLPLLHLLFAPVMRLMPENSEVFRLMRFAIAPFAAGCSLVMYAAARPVWGVKRAAAGALLFSVMHPWLAKSVEFRNDTLWIFCWLASLAFITRRRPMFFLAGLAFGLSLLASIKSVPLLMAHVLALISQRRGVAIADAVRAAIGAALPLLVVAAAALQLGIFRAMIHDTLLFNAAAPVNPARRIGGALAFVVVAALIEIYARWLRRRVGAAAAHLVLFSLWFSSLLLAFWPILTPRDFLPIEPLLAMGIAIWWPWTQWSTALFIPMAVATIASVFDARLWLKDPSREAFVDAAVAVTAKGDYVFDLKGDAIFRRRPVDYVYEDVGRALTANGTIADEGPEQIAAHGACAAIHDSPHIPPRTRRFLNEHFIGAGLVRVCGAEASGPTFEVAVPQTYSVVAADPSAVVIDGRPYRGPRQLAAGTHTFEPGTNRTATVIWSRAAKEHL